LKVRGIDDDVNPLICTHSFTGWIEGVTKLDGGMALGERAVLTISSDLAYGE